MPFGDWLVWNNVLDGGQDWTKNRNLSTLNKSERKQVGLGDERPQNTTDSPQTWMLQPPKHDSNKFILSHNIIL